MNPLEEVPTFLCNGETIVEVCYTGWQETYPGGWDLVRGTDKIPVTGTIDRVVYELPIGCYEQRMNLRAGDSISFRAGKGNGDILTQCRVSHGFAEVADELLTNWAFPTVTLS